MQARSPTLGGIPGVQLPERQGSRAIPRVVTVTPLIASWVRWNAPDRDSGAWKPHQQGLAECCKAGSIATIVHCRGRRRASAPASSLSRPPTSPRSGRSTDQPSWSSTAHSTAVLVAGTSEEPRAPVPVFINAQHPQGDPVYVWQASSPGKPS